MRIDRRRCRRGRSTTPAGGLLAAGVPGRAGFVVPATTALAQEAGRRALGTASALQGGLALLVGAAVTPMTGLVGYDSLVPMGLLMVGFFVGAVVTVLLPARRAPTITSSRT